MSRLTNFARRFCEEPPIRLISRCVLRRTARSLPTRVRWGLADRPQYLLGVYAAAQQACQQQVAEFCVAEFGVAGGNGLLALEAAARDVEHQFGVRIHVYGFDSGQGLPAPCDYRDHPDAWVCGDYPMDVDSLKRKLAPETELILGNIATTVPDFIRKKQHCPLGFAAVDLDLYSSTSQALRVLSLPGKSILHRCFLYFDDIAFLYCHRFAGELLAIDEFNQINDHVKIDRWYGLPSKVVFRDADWVPRMYIAHDLVALSQVRLKREPDRVACRLVSHSRRTRPTVP